MRGGGPASVMTSGMARVLVFGLAVATLTIRTPPFSAQAPAPHALDARASDPDAMGWMVGSPPPPDKQIRFSDGSWLRFPQMRWAFSHIRQLVPTSVVRRGEGGVITPLPRTLRTTDIDAVTFQPLGRIDSMTCCLLYTSPSPRD